MKQSIVTSISALLVTAVCLASFCAVMSAEQATAQNIKTIVLSIQAGH